jgi:CBS domain-containing protein
MKVREIMTKDPVCCVLTDTAQRVAQVLRDEDIGSVPIIEDHESCKLIGMITDRDLCCSVIADGLDPKTTTIVNLISSELVSCRDSDNLEKCEQEMQQHQIRRMPVVDGEGCCIGIVAQADLALHCKPEEVSKTIAEISRAA